MAKNMWEIRTDNTYARKLLEPSQVASLTSRGFMLTPFIGNDKKEIPTTIISKSEKPESKPHGTGRAVNYARSEVLSNMGKIRPELIARKHTRRSIS